MTARILSPPQDFGFGLMGPNKPRLSLACCVVWGAVSASQRLLGPNHLSFATANIHEGKKPSGKVKFTVTKRDTSIKNKNEVTMQHFVSLVSLLQPTDSTLLLEAHGLEQTHVNDGL